MKPSVLIGASLILGATAAFLAAELTKNPVVANGARVVIATDTIPAGTELSSTQLKALDWPTPIVPNDVFSDPKKLEHRFARQTIAAGELVLESKLASTGSKGGLAATIATGKRAISVRVNDVVGVAGFALPGNYVDVLVSAKDANNRVFSKTVLNRVKVLAVAQDTTVDPTKAKVVNAVTLELTPEESEYLDLARSIGTLSLALRNELDTSASKSTGARLGDITESSVISQELSAHPENPSAETSTPTPVKKTASKKKMTSSPAAQNNRVEEIRGIKENEGAK